MAEKRNPPQTLWSDEQKAIYRWFAKPNPQRRALMIRARAGSGKTTSLKEAFSHAPEETMLYVVFNKRNQVEAQEKITDDRVDVRTLHSLGYSFIRQVWSRVKPDDNVEYDRIRSAIGQDAPDDVYSAIYKIVAFAKNTCIGVPEVSLLKDIADAKGFDATAFEQEEHGGWNIQKLAQHAAKVMEISKSRDEQGRISFNDMVWLPVTNRWVRPRFHLVAADEYQDLCPPQVAMIEGATKKSGRLIACGDPAQMIYLFRGSTHTCMDDFKIKFDADELGLTTTYRCARKIVEMAAKFVPDYKWAPNAPEGVIETMSEPRMMETLVPGNVVLSRINAPLMGLCISMLKRGMPSRIEGKDIGKTLLGIVKRFNAQSIDHYLNRVRGWLASEIKRAQSSPRHKEEKMQIANDKAEMLIAVSEGCQTVSEIENRLLTLFQDSDGRPTQKVVFSSVHKYKGLEADKVYLLEYTFNLKFKNQSPAEQQCERNCRYVAITRARKHLVLVQSQKPSPLQTHAQTKPAPKPVQSTLSIVPTPTGQDLPAIQQQVGASGLPERRQLSRSPASGPRPLASPR